MPTGQRDQPIATQFGKPLAANFRPVAPAFNQISPGQQFAQLLVTLPVTHEQQQAIGIVRRIRIGDPHIRPRHRLHPLAARPGIELDQSEQIAQIRQCHRRHAIAYGTLDGIADTDNAVGD